MPGGKTQFKKDWLLHTDGQGHKISSWCQPCQEVGKAFCFICKKKGFLCNNQGLLQLLQHARGQSHKTMVNEILGGSHMVLHPLSQQMQAKPVITTKYSICFNCYCCFKTARDTLGRSNAVGHCSVIVSRMKQQGLN